MKNKKSKKAIKKIKSAARGAVKGAGKIANAFQKEWKKEGPQREKYIKGIKKIGADVFDVIKKDINDIKANNKNKNK